MQNLLEELKNVLHSDERLIIDGKLVKNKIVELALAMDAGLIELLLKNESIKKHFFQDMDDVLVFDKVAFQRFVSNKQFLPDSFTAFKNKIGLTAGKAYITESKEVVLAWPYKDCVLEGGQTKEDQKRKEIFWNETLAPDEIDRLLAPKAVTNFKKYDSDGQHAVEDIGLNDNLIIKGNNLLALHSLKKQYASQVKLIYIDPPYNTGSDSFGYNDNFNHSTWLTFMRNRLEVAKELLREDGSIWINIDDDESHYLKILCDEVFGKRNFLGSVVWQHSIQGKGYRGKFSLHHNYILCYSKSEQFELGQMERTKKHNVNYKNPDNDPRGRWRSGDIRNALYRPNLIYDLETPSGKIIFPPQNGWRFSKETMKAKIDTGQIVFNEDETKVTYKIYLKDQDGRVPETIWFADEVGTTRTANSEIKALFGSKLFDTPKPEHLLQRIIHIGSNDSDIILDFYGGSGTTGAVAHKMKRTYILIEQMDYIHELPEARLKKVIAGEQGGISKSVNWQGGGSFIYCELIQYNASIIDKINQANATEDLQSIWREMEKTDFISYKIKPEIINKNIHEFKALSLEDQKHFLITVLDKNQLYVNYSEIDDEDYQISERDKQLNKQFYGEA